MINFTENILDKLLKFYQFTMDGDSKVILFKIMHISIVVHHPASIGIDDLLTDSNGANRQILNGSIDLFTQHVSKDAQLWNKHLRNMQSIIERDIVDLRKRCIRLNPTAPVICPIFVRMAAKLCSVVCSKKKNSFLFSIKKFKF